MIITSKELRVKFEYEWKNLRQIWLRNKKYHVPTLAELKTVVNQYKIDMPIIKGFNECENFALFLHAKIKEHWVINGSDEYNWSFGDFICKKETTFFKNLIHTACICLTEEGFYIIEPMEENKILKINDNYKPFFINLM